MGLTFEPEAPPLRVDDAGAVRVGKTRVTLVTVIHAFRNGEAPEDIVRSFPTVSLADAYGVIAYYLRHRVEVDAFLADYEREADEIRQKLVGGQQGLRERLLARLGGGPTAEAV